jgi:putative ABC transport system permease protein
MLRRASVEAQLMLGATRWDAAAPVTCDAVRSALMPTINSMSATGLVSLPGVMTGQILSGVPPVEAVKYGLWLSRRLAGAAWLGKASGARPGVARRDKACPG